MNTYFGKLFILMANLTFKSRCQRGLEEVKGPKEVNMKLFLHLKMKIMKVLESHQICEIVDSIAHYELKGIGYKIKLPFTTNDASSVFAEVLMAGTLILKFSLY